MAALVPGAADSQSDDKTFREYTKLVIALNSLMRRELTHMKYFLYSS